MNAWSTWTRARFVVTTFQARSVVSVLKALSWRLTAATVKVTIILFVTVSQSVSQLNVGLKETHLRAMGFIQCYLPPATGERAQP